MRRAKVVPRKIGRLTVLNVLPIVLIIVPCAVALNLWAAFDQEAFYQKSLYLCDGLAVTGLTSSVLALPEVLRITNGKFLTLAKLVEILIVVVSSLLAILIQIAQKVDIQTMMVVVLLMVAAGLIYVFKRWTSWALK